MAVIPGIPIAGPLVPTDTRDKYPIFNPDYQVGGYRDVADIGTRDAIPIERRRVGMHVYVLSTGETWALIGGTANSNWSDQTPTTGGGGAVSDGDKGVITVVGGVWGFDPTVVTPFAQTVLDDADATAMLATLGAASLNGPVFISARTSTSMTGTDNSNRIPNTAYLTSYYAKLADPIFTGTPRAITPAAGATTTEIVNAEWVRARIDALITGAPGTLDTLDEIAQALGDDPNFAATMTVQLASKLTNNLNTDRIWSRSSAGAGVAEEITFTPFMRTLADDANAGAAQTTLGLGTLATRTKTQTGDYTAGSIALADLASITQFTVVGRGSGSGVPSLLATSAFTQGLFPSADAAAWRTALGVVNADLTDYVKKDGTTAFTAAQTGVVATSTNHLVVKSQVDTVAIAAATADGKAVTAQSTADTAQVTANAAMPKAGGAFTGPVSAKVTALTDGATIDTDCSTGNIFTVTLGGARTLANPTNVVVGATYIWLITQDGTGGRTLALGSNFKLGRDDSGTVITYTASTTAGETDVITVVARTTTNLVTTIVKGYAA